MRVLLAATQEMSAGRAAALVTVIGVRGSAPRRRGARMLVRADGSLVGTVGGGAWEHRLVREALEAMREGVPRRVALNLTRDLGMCCGGEMEAFVEPLEIAPELVVYGAGHVGAATARFAAAAGFRVTLVDDRGELLADAAVPDEVRRIEADARRILGELPRGPRAHHLVVTHDHALDQDLVERLLPEELAWLGLIASRAKVARFLVRFRAAGMDPALFPRLRAPVGLDIGAETPEEIAISIVAELIRLRRGATGPAVALAEHPHPARTAAGAAPPVKR
jgi:xanthine dehydrogenase accessory factor